MNLKPRPGASISTYGIAEVSKFSASVECVKYLDPRCCSNLGLYSLFERQPCEPDADHEPDNLLEIKTKQKLKKVWIHPFTQIKNMYRCPVGLEVSYQ